MEKQKLYDQLISFLNKERAHYRLIDHAPEGRTDIVSPMRGNKLSEAAKCMILKLNIGKKQVVNILAVVPGDARVNLNKIKYLFGASFVSFAKREDAEYLAGSVAGTVLPFSFNRNLELIVDPTLLKNKEIYFNAARLDRSMALNIEDYIRLTKARTEDIRDTGDTLEPKKTTSLDSLRHTCAHLLAASVLELWPGSHNAIGPSIEEGFYQDFDLGDIKISESDLPKIEQLMNKKVRDWKSFAFKEVTLMEAEELFKHNPYKVEMAREFAKEGKKLSTNNPGGFLDLCKMGHVENPSRDLRNFKLLSVAGAYWRGSEKNKMLTRIYGTAFFTKEELAAYLKMMEEAKKRDHRKLGKELELFTINNEVGQGITIWLPNGSIIRREIENYMVTEQIKMGFKHVYSPHIGKRSLWEKSGHWDLYREKMYSPMDVDGVEYLVKPMTCPMHIQSFEFRPKSYKNLPYRIAEIGSVYRYEQSGELAGLLRVRAFTQDDAHIFCTPEQTVDEFLSVFNFIQKLYAVFGFNDYRVRLGVRSKKEKYLGSDELWEKAQEKAISALEKSKSKYFISEGDAAFYGPKADFLIKDALGREWQCGTVQIDFMLSERFGLKYIDKDGKEKTPVMIHRAPLGSLERFLAILIENYAGAFPLWLAPVQVMILPISDKHIPYSKQVYEELKKNNIRVEINEEPATIGKKIRQATLQKIPYMVIMGDQEVDGSTIAVRTREGKNLGKQKITEFIQSLKTTIEKYVS